MARKKEELTVLLTPDQLFEALKAKGFVPKLAEAKRPIGFNPYWYKEAA